MLNLHLVFVKSPNFFIGLSANFIFFSENGKLKASIFWSPKKHCDNMGITVSFVKKFYNIIYENLQKNNLFGFRIKISCYLLYSVELTCNGISFISYSYLQCPVNREPLFFNVDLSFKLVSILIILASKKFVGFILIISSCTSNKNSKI